MADSIYQHLNAIHDKRISTALQKVFSKFMPRATEPASTGVYLDIGAVTATATELNRAADTSARVVVLAVSTAITEADHDGKTISMTGAGGARTFTLPVPVAGMKFRFVVGAVNTSGHIIKSVAGTHVMAGSVLTLSDGAAAVLGYTAAATSDTITLNGTTTGGVSIGDWVQVEALSATQWAVSGNTTSSGTEATPFSDTVA